MVILALVQTAGAQRPLRKGLEVSRSSLLSTLHAGLALCSHETPFPAAYLSYHMDSLKSDIVSQPASRHIYPLLFLCWHRARPVDSASSKKLALVRAFLWTHTAPCSTGMGRPLFRSVGALNSPAWYLDSAFWASDIFREHSQNCANASYRILLQVQGESTGLNSGHVPDEPHTEA